MNVYTFNMVNYSIIKVTFAENTVRLRHMAATFATLVIDGYIRKVQTVFKDIIIPQEINIICLNFYNSNNIIILSIIYDIQQIENWELYISNIDNQLNSQIKLSAKECENKVPIQWESVLYHTNHLNYIPLEIQPCIKSNNCNAIFKIGGCNCMAQQHKNFMLIFNYNSREKIIDSHKIDLPLIPSNNEITGHSIVYSNEYGLLCIGGFNDHEQYENKIYQLLFNCNEYKHLNVNDSDWQWKQLIKMNKQRYQPSTIIFDNNKLFIAGGESNQEMTWNDIEMFDLNKNEFIQNIQNMKYTRKNAAICYDYYSNNIYIGGGFTSTNVADLDIYPSKNVEYYNCIKNKWYDLGILNTSHSFGHLCILIHIIYCILYPKRLLNILI
eukprot:101854_1